MRQAAEWACTVIATVNLVQSNIFRSASVTGLTECDAGGSGVVLLDERFLRSAWSMWQLGLIMAALPGQTQPASPRNRRGPLYPWCLWTSTL